LKKGSQQEVEEMQKWDLNASWTGEREASWTGERDASWTGERDASWTG
jgi:hypothetical protein